MKMNKFLHCKTKYINELGLITKHKYPNGRMALAMDSVEGFPLIKITVNCDDVTLEPDEIIVKSYSENEGLLDWLLIEGLVENTNKVVTVGWESCAVVRITDKLWSLII